MKEDFRLDSHKLIFHPKKVADWMDGKRIAPITVEISPSGSCNHRCVFCGLDYLGYKPSFLDKDLLIRNLAEMKAAGTSAIVLAGEGEPLLHKDITIIIQKAKELGLDIGMSSNGVYFNREISNKCLSSLTWVRFSVNAGSSQTHMKVHRGKEEDFEIILKNLADAVEEKHSQKLSTTLGVQMLLIPENVDEVKSFAKKLKDIGLDYFTVKPFSKHPKSFCDIDSQFTYNGFIELEKDLKQMQTDNFTIFFRSNSMKKKDDTRKYSSCLGIPFWAYIDSNADVWACIAYIGDKDYWYGNLSQSSFSKIIEGKRYKDVINRIANMNIDKCRQLCRLDSINEYLYQLKFPGRHVNFI
jgi:MoaA/NifB/PqqE/SkfB family radical SAM enzyme